jgi:sigma-B regulation protein RsbU (phosphoserine phosphatase)
MSVSIERRPSRASAWTQRILRYRKEHPIAFWPVAALIVLTVLLPIPHISASVGPLWVLAFVFSALASVASIFRWMRWRLLWRLRNRLLVTYGLVGLTPVVLVLLLACIAAYVLFGQFANFAAVSEINAELAELGANNQALALHFQQEIMTSAKGGSIAGLPATAPPEIKSILTVPKLRVGVFLDGKPQELNLPPEHALTNISEPPNWAKDQFRGLTLNKDEVYFRALTREYAGGHTLSVITSLPLDSEFLGRVAHGLGRVTLFPKTQLKGDLSRAKPKGAEGDSIIVPPDSSSAGKPQGQAGAESVSGGKLPAAANFLDIPINFPTTLETTDWATGQSYAILALVRSRPSLLYDRLFRGSLIIGGGVRIALVFTAILFALLELLAIFLAARLSRTITKSVSNLYHATREVDQGRLDYRIPVTRRDQLAALSGSFNTMSASLVRLLAEQQEKERLQSELAIAQEVQSNLFPACDVRLGRLELHGRCQPARTVSGDYYDFLLLGSTALCMAIGDISGKGISAALLMAALHSAVRAYRFAEEEILLPHTNGAAIDGQATGPLAEIFASPGSLMRLLNLHLYRSTQPEKYATLFLAHYDPADRMLRYSNGGQLPPLLLRADGSVARLDQGGTVVGLLDNMRYDEGALRLEPGDLLVAYSDGVTEPENEFGDFGEDRLMELVRSHRHLPLEEISNRVLHALQDWIGAAEQPDDITLVLARQQ